VRVLPPSEGISSGIVRDWASSRRPQRGWIACLTTRPSPGLDADLRFGWLTYVKSTEKTTTSIRLRLDRFIGEMSPDSSRKGQSPFDLRNRLGHSNRRRERGNFLGRRFMLEGPGVQPTRFLGPSHSSRVTS